MKCPECRFENRGGAKFCGECGYDLKPPKKTFDELSETESRTLHPTTEKPSSDVAPIIGERKHVTVLFSDLTGYTTMSKKLDPEEVKEITTQIFDLISRVVVKYEGFIENYAGDAVMALFGAEEAHEDDPIRAIKPRLSSQRYQFKCTLNNGFLGRLAFPQLQIMHRGWFSTPQRTKLPIPRLSA